MVRGRGRGVVHPGRSGRGRPGRRRGGPPCPCGRVGDTYLALATLNRVVDPCSTRTFADWWATTAGPRWVKVDDAALDHRRFWDTMDLLGEDNLRAIETSVYGSMIDRYGFDLAGLALNMTNFATYIDSTNGRAPIAHAHRSAAGRPGPGGHPRRRHPDRLARLCRRRPGCHPVHHRAGRTGRPCTTDSPKARTRPWPRPARGWPKLQARLARGQHSPPPALRPPPAPQHEPPSAGPARRRLQIWPGVEWGRWDAAAGSDEPFRHRQSGRYSPAQEIDCRRRKETLNDQANAASARGRTVAGPGRRNRQIVAEWRDR